MNEVNDVERFVSVLNDVERFVKWESGTPPNEVLVMVKCDDCRGDYTMMAMRKDYKRPKAGQKGWRWIKEDGEVLRKETPTAWAYI